MCRQTCFLFFAVNSFFFYTFAVCYNYIKNTTLNYKDLFHRIFALLSTPAKAWEDIATKGEENQVLEKFVYPMIGICSISEFLGAFIGRDFMSDIVQLALTRSCGVAVSLFIGFFLASYLIKALNVRLGNQSSEKDIQMFVGYSLVVTFVLQIVSALFSILIIHFLKIYTLFVVFEGARRLIRIPEYRLTIYTVVSTIIILMSPAVIEFIFNKLSVTLN